MPTTYVPITDPEQAEQLYEAGLLWEHNIVTMVGHPPVPAHDWAPWAITSVLGHHDYTDVTHWRLYIQLED